MVKIRPSQSDPLPNKRSPESSCESNNQPLIYQMTKWSEINTNHFLDILLESKCGQNCEFYNGKGLSGIFVNYLVNQLNTQTNILYTSSQVKEKHRRMKSEWAAFRGLIDQTGVGWNSETNTIVVDDEKWEDFFKRDNANKFYKKGLSRYEDMNELWLRVEATGAFARSCNEAPLSSDGERELLRREYVGDGASSQSRNGYGKSSRKGKNQMHIDTFMSSYPYSLSQSGKSGSRSGKSVADTCNDSALLKHQAYQAIIDRYKEKAENAVWTIGRCFDEIKNMDELKDANGNIHPNIYFKDATLFESDATRESFMHFPPDVRVLFVRSNCQ